MERHDAPTQQLMGLEKRGLLADVNDSINATGEQTPIAQTKEQLQEAKRRRQEEERRLFLTEEEQRKNKESIILGLLNHRTKWTGSYCHDLSLFMKQTHVLISICFVHKMHRYTKCERMQVFGCLCLFGWGLALITYSSDGSKPVWYMSIMISGWLCALSYILTECMTCRCIAEGSILRFIAGPCGAHFDKCMGASGECVMGFAYFWAAVLVLVGILTGNNGGLSRSQAALQVLEVWSLGQFGSWVLNLPICFMYFTFYRWLEGPPESPKSSMYPHGSTYPTEDGEDVFWANDRCSCKCGDDESSSDV